MRRVGTRGPAARPCRPVGFRELICVLVCSAVSVSLASSAAAADNQSSDDQSSAVVKHEDGLHFKVPADWPIERRNGVLAPIPLEEYLAKKFGALEQRVQQLEQQLAAFDLCLRVMEEQAKRSGAGGLRATEAK